MMAIFSLMQPQDYQRSLFFCNGMFGFVNSGLVKSCVNSLGSKNCEEQKLRRPRPVSYTHLNNLLAASNTQLFIL